MLNQTQTINNREVDQALSCTGCNEPLQAISCGEEILYYKCRFCTLKFAYVGNILQNNSWGWNGLQKG